MTFRPFVPFRSRSWILVSLLLAPAGVLAQDAPQPPAPETRETGLPPQVDWTFNLDASWGTFGFANSLYQNPKEDVDEQLSDQWFEGAVKPALSGRFTLASTSEFYGKVSAVGERTYGSVPEAFGADISSFGPEDAFIGWRSGQSIGSSDNLFDVSVGREQYRLGHGLLLWDGSAEGGSRGGYWTNARKAFEFASIARVKPGPHTAEIFYLDKDELDEADSGTRTWGANYELALGPSTLGATYLHWMAHEDMRPERDGLDVFNVRAYAAPVPSLPALSVELEYASERNGDLLDSNAWTAQGAYALENVAWKPKLSYRYAFFQGDNPETAANEAFDPLLPGFYDWGAWWQGEIAGEYFVSNSNLTSHLLRAHFTPSDSIGTGLMFFRFGLDRPESYGAGVTDDDLAFEMDAYLDWKVNRVFTVSVVGAFANPQSAAEQAFDRTKNFGYGMVFFAYSY